MDEVRSVTFLSYLGSTIPCSAKVAFLCLSVWIYAMQVLSDAEGLNFDSTDE